MSICDQSPIEKLNVKLCKFLLGVNKSSTNSAVRAELGRYPLVINVFDHAVRYSNRIYSLDDESFVKLSCLDSNTNSVRDSWTLAIQKIQHTFSDSTLKVSMQSVYRDGWASMIQNDEGKLRTYSKFKSSFCLENYIIQFPLHMRQNLTKLRISAHHLAIETGRYSQPKTPIEKRLCFYCKQIEDEFHLLFECNLYEEDRLRFTDQLSQFSCLNVRSTREMFHTLMSCMQGDLEVGRVLCDFINSCFNKRSIKLAEIKEDEIYLRPISTVTQSGRVSKRPNILNL